jgi:hypothetical protein
MHRPNHSLIALMTVTCVLLLLVTLVFSLAAPNSQAIAFFQGPSNTPYYTPAFKATLIPFDHQQSNAGFGAAVSTSNGIILVGAPNSFSNQGAAYIFDQPNFTTWDQTAELIAPDGDPGDLFGSAVSIGIGPTGSVAVIGAPNDDAAAVDAGAVYVYVRDGQDWLLTARINSPDAAAGDQFGYSVGYSNGNIIVGAPFADAGGFTDIGAAYIFIGSGSNWSLDQKLDYTLMHPPGHLQRNDDQRFGYAVDIYGNEAVVSSVLASDIGNRVQIFTRVVNRWYFHQALQPPSDNIGFGRVIAVYHDSVVVGAPLYDDATFGLDAGRIFVYRWAGNLVLQPDGDYTHFGAGHQGGSSVDVFRGNSIAGAPYATVEPEGGAKGSVLVFDPNARLIRETALSDDSQFGASVAFWDGDLAIGAPGEDYNGLTNPGVVYVYQVHLAPWVTPTATLSNYLPTSTFRIPSLTPSYTPTGGPSHTATPSHTPTSTPATSTAPPNATIAPHFFAVSRPTLTWDNITWALGYQIQIDDDPAFASPITAELSADTLSYTLVYPLANDTYYWQVRAKRNDIDWGDWSATETIIVSAP